MVLGIFWTLQNIFLSNFVNILLNVRLNKDVGSVPTPTFLLDECLAVMAVVVVRVTSGSVIRGVRSAMM